MYILGLIIRLSKEIKVTKLIKKTRLNFRVFAIFGSNEKNIYISI